MLFKQPVVSPLCVWVVPLCLPLNMQLRPSERILEKIHTLLWVRQVFFGIHVYLLVSDLYLVIVRFISITLKTLVYSNMCIILIYNHIHWFIDFLWEILISLFMNFRLFVLDSLWIVLQYININLIFFILDAPATVERVQLACASDTTQFVIE